MSLEWVRILFRAPPNGWKTQLLLESPGQHQIFTVTLTIFNYFKLKKKWGQHVVSFVSNIISNHLGFVLMHPNLYRHAFYDALYIEKKDHLIHYRQVRITFIHHVVLLFIQNRKWWESSTAVHYWLNRTDKRDEKLHVPNSSEKLNLIQTDGAWPQWFDFPSYQTWVSSVSPASQNNLNGIYIIIKLYVSERQGAEWVNRRM